MPIVLSSNYAGKIGLLSDNLERIIPLEGKITLEVKGIDEGNIRDSILDQAELCRQFGSPFTGSLLDSFAEVLDKESGFGAAVLNWTGNADALHDALAMRISAAFHALVRSGRNAKLAALYPPNPQPTDIDLRSALYDALAKDSVWLEKWLCYPPQTNEVGRSACLYLGLMQVAQQTGLPIRLFEIGSSAGLNLNLDRYGYTFGGLKCGDQDSILQLEPEWEGEDTIGVDPVIIERRGCDLAPFNLGDAREKERLQAYIWPDQKTRLSRIENALLIAERYPPEVEQADASKWVLENIAPSSKKGVATVLMHSISWGYISKSGQQQIIEHMKQMGMQATLDTPLCWLTLELDENTRPQLKLRLWPETDIKVLAATDPHCWKIDWIP